VNRGFCLFIPSNAPDRLAEAVEDLLLERGLMVERLDEPGLEKQMADLGLAPQEPGAPAKLMIWVAGRLTRNGVVLIVDRPSPALEKRVDQASLETVRPPLPPETADSLPLAAAQVIRSLELLKRIPPAPSSGYSAEETETLKKRLEDLGYM
jgi:hypothetical protein